MRTTKRETSREGRDNVFGGGGGAPTQGEGDEDYSRRVDDNDIARDDAVR
jgi:hypothetical protein